MEQIYTGVIELRKPEDWVAGAETGIVYEVICEDGNWNDYLPSNEKQSSVVTETMACTNFSWTNALETQINYKIKHNLIDAESVKKLEELGFFDADYKFNISDRALAKMSNTGKNGNYATASPHTARHKGLLPEKDWAFTPGMTWDEYYAEIPQSLQEKALKILDILEFQYEEVPKELIEKHLKQAPLVYLTPVCPSWNTGTVTSCGLTQSQHATMGYGYDFGYLDFDTYEPFKKKLAFDYPINYILKTVVSIKKPKPEPENPTWEFKIDLKYGMDNIDVKKMQEVLIKEGVLQYGLNTGKFLNKTLQAVKDFQKKYWLYPDGIVGKKTRAKLNQFTVKKNLIDAIILVESGGNDYAEGDKDLLHHAYGCMQIRQPAVDDVNKIMGTTYKAQDCLGNRELSVKIFKAYMEIYATKSKLKREPTDEDKARIWNGGPMGWAYDSTLGYWQKVKKYL